MAQLKLTKTVVEGLQPAAQEQVIWDETLPGFGVRVKPTGVRSYIVQYRTREDGTSKRMTVGQHGPRLTFEQAKKRAREVLADAGRGHDPVSERRSKRQAPTLKDLSSEYLEKYATPKKRLKSVRDERAMLDNIVLPKLGPQKVAAVGRREIESLHAALQDRPYQANRVLALLSKISTLPSSGAGARTIP